MGTELIIELPRLTAADRPLKMLLIPKGRFRMGQRGQAPDEEPVHEVEIPTDFYMAETLLTQRQYRAIAEQCLPELQKISGNLGVNPGQFPKSGPGDNYPVECVSWDEAMVICRWLTQSGNLPSGWCASLPSEAHWEYACRAGSESQYSFGDRDEELPDYGWFNGNSKGTTHPVAQRRPNAWGLYDMHGNVIEWCLDLYDPRAYRKRISGAPVTILQSETAMEQQSAPAWLQPLCNLLQRFAAENSSVEQRRFNDDEAKLLTEYKERAESWVVADADYRRHVQACTVALRRQDDGPCAWPANSREIAAQAMGMFLNLLDQYGGAFRVVRGGSWFNSAWNCRAAFRIWWRPGFRFWFLGFRVCLFPGSVPQQATVAGVTSEPVSVDAARRQAAAESEDAGVDVTEADFSRASFPERSDGTN